jgi:transmembrane sensor
MAIADRLRLDEALDWVRHLHDPAFSDWEAHVAWLEADPRNAAAFDEASMMIETATQGLAPPRPLAASPMPVNDNLAEPVAAPRRWTRLGTGFGLAVAAGLAAVIAVPSMMRTGAQPYLIQTAPGERRVVTVDGTGIALNGDSRLRLDHADARVAVLEQGEAFFTVRHDAAHPFAVQAGGATFQDVGTAFDIVQRAGTTRIAVREGAVLYDPGGAAVRLDGGQALRVADNTAAVQMIDTAAVGAWRSGRLLYRDAPLTDVAQDIARNIGEPVLVDPALIERRFSGVVIIDADRARMFRRVAAVTGVAIRRAPQGWQMVMPPR